jgi:D-3-phosphoglycerate dehydrogenase
MAQGPRIVVGAGADFPDVAPERRILGRLRAEVVDARGRDAAETLALARDADALITDYFACSPEVIGQLGRCRVICQYGVGIDKVDVDAATAAGIVVTHTPGYCVDELADHTLALMLTLARSVDLYAERVRGGAWSYHGGREMHRLRGGVLGLVGLGRVGFAVATRAQAFGLSCIAADPYIDARQLAGTGIVGVELDRLLEQADIVTLHAPLTGSTRHMLGASELARMRRGAILVNTARGGLIDQEALVRAVRDGHLAGAGLDVLEREPPGPVERALIELPNVVVTPHAGFLSAESLVAVQTQAAEEVLRVLSGDTPLHAVNRPLSAA